MTNTTYAYCQNGCGKHFRREKGELLEDFIFCGRKCEESFVRRNAEFLLEHWEEKYYIPKPAELYNNQLSFPQTI